MPALGRLAGPLGRLGAAGGGRARARGGGCGCGRGAGLGLLGRGRAGWPRAAGARAGAGASGGAGGRGDEWAMGAAERPRPAGLGSSSPAEAAWDLPAGRGYAARPGSDGTGGWLAHRGPGGEPGSGPGSDWVRAIFRGEGEEGADMSAAAAFSPGSPDPPRILVLYGSLREKSFSKLGAYECARILECLGADVRVYDPHGLPVRDPTLEDHPKVQELRNLSLWSQGHVWVSPEMHGCVTAAFKNQVDWLPLNSGSVRPTQGRTCAVLQVNGGSQSFNVVNELRRLARWMRMPCTTNQSSVAMAWKEFDDDGRMKPSSFRDRLTDVMEEHYKFTLIMREHADFLVDRYSERKEIAKQGRLLTQAEKEALKDAAK